MKCTLGCPKETQGFSLLIFLFHLEKKFKPCDLKQPQNDFNN